MGGGLGEAAHTCLHVATIVQRTAEAPAAVIQAADFPEQDGLFPVQ